MSGFGLENLALSCHFFRLKSIFQKLIYKSATAIWPKNGQKWAKMGKNGHFSGKNGKNI